MEIYDLIKFVIRLIPLAVLAGAYFYFLKLNWYKRFFPMLIIGWVVVALTTQLFWSYSFHFAPNAEIQRQVALKDGAPQVFGVIFGWIYGLVILGIFELLNLFRLGIHKVKLNLGNNA